MFKIAGVKNDKEFYAKYPTEESFMAKYGAEFKKAQMGLQALSGGAQTTTSMPNMVGGQLPGTGAGGSGGGGGIMENMLGKADGKGSQGMAGASLEGKLIDGYGQLRAARRARKDAQMWAGVSDVTADAAESIDVDSRRQQSDIIQGQYNNIMQPVNGEELFPINGVGTNVLAQNGANVGGGRRMAPSRRKVLDEKSKAQTIKDSLFDKRLKKISEEPGFKEYMKNKKAQNGGEFESMQQGGTANYSWGQNITTPQGPSSAVGADMASGGGGTPWGMIGNSASGIANSLNGGQEAGGNIGGTLGETAGMAIGGPIGGAIGKTLGTVAGNFLDTNKEKTEQAQNTMQRNITRAGWANWGKSNKTAYTKYGGEFQNGGDIQPIWGGGVETESYNPYTSGGETLMFNGDSHKEGGIGVNYAGNKIEAEGGEPAMKMQHGGEGEGLVIFGDLPISKDTAAMMGDPNAQGRKFKKYVENIAGDETKANMKKDRATKIASTLTPIEKFDRLKLGTQEIIQKGSDAKLKMYAEQKENAAMAQNSINQTAEELGADPVMVARGGDKMGKWLQKKMPQNKKFFGEEESAYAQNGNEQTHIMPDGSEMPGATHQGKYGMDVYAQNGAGIPNYADKNSLSPIETPLSYEGPIMLQQQRNEQRAAAMRNQDPYPAANRIELTDEQVGIQPTLRSNDNWRITPDQPGKGDTPGAALKGFGQQSQDPASGLYGGASQKKYDRFKEMNSNWFDFENFNPKNPGHVEELQKEYNKRTKGNKVTEDGKFGDQTVSMLMGIDTGMQPVKMSGQPVELGQVPIQSTSEGSPSEKKGKFNPMPYFNALAPYLNRGTDAEGLDGNQLMGEMFSLSNNQVEPVYAQGYRPNLDVPYDISLQDQLNRNTSGVRAASRMSQGNPAAQAMIQAQGYAQDQPILAEQFRQNQGMKNQVYNNNRATLNEAKLKNLGIFDQQAERQSQARSNTKEATQLALNSVSSKYQQNKLEQRTLMAYENMYNYRFGKNYRAQNVNDAVDFEAMAQNSKMNGGSGTGGVPNGWEVTSYDKDGNPRLKRSGTGDYSQKGTDFNPDATAKYGSMTRSLKKF